jgi:hypothetical protein
MKNRVSTYAPALLFVVFLAVPVHAAVFEYGGFFEGAFGARTESDTTRKDSFNLGEARLQLKGAFSPGVKQDWSPELTFKFDLLADGYDGSIRGLAREAAIFLTPLDFMDIKAGRQVLTWGTGDYLFVNDLFPKDYVSFFIGRDDEYLKLPSDALRASVFSPVASLDVAIIPVMEPNNSVRGSRVSFYDGLSGVITGEEAGRVFREPARTVENGELAMRVYRTFGSYEGAAYFFRGFYKEPRGITDPAREVFFYPRLNVYGMSLRGPLPGGIGNFEAGYYDSRQDRDGTDPLVENSAVKYLFGYSRDLGGDLKAGMQYLIEQMLDYGAYRRGLGAGEKARDEFKHLVTLRLTKLLRAQTVETGLFVFFSPSDSDAYIRPHISYKATDNLKLSAGANVFAGRYDMTEFGQFERNDNVYARVRYSF